MKSLARNTLVYGLGVVLSRAVSFLMLPIYTRFLTPADYGVLTLLQMTTDVTAILLSAGTTAGVLRFYFKADRLEDRHSVIDTALALLAGLNGLGAVLLMVTAPWISAVVLKGAGDPHLIRIAAGSFFLDSFILVPLLFAQAQERAGLFVGASFAKLVLQVSLNLLFLVGFRWGVTGVLLGTLGANVIMGTAMTAWVLRQTGFHVSRHTFRDLRRFGIPYQFVTAGTFVLTFGDRFFLQAFHGVSVVGLYGLAYQFGFVLMSLGALPLLQAWNPQRFQAATQPRHERDRGYAEGFLFLDLLVVSLAVVIALFIEPALHLMSDAAFHPAAAYVPIILLAYIVEGWINVVQFGIDVSEQTKYATIATWIGVVSIVVLYLLLIPPFGAMGAALATAGGFFIRFLCYFYFAQKVWPVDYRWAAHLRLIALAVVIGVLGVLVAPQVFWPQVGTATLLLACYSLAVWVLVLGREQRTRMVVMVGDLVRLARNLRFR